MAQEHGTPKVPRIQSKDFHCLIKDRNRGTNEVHNNSEKPTLRLYNKWNLNFTSSHTLEFGPFFGQVIVNF